MTWDEDQIRNSLRRSLGPVHVPAQIPSTTLRRARRRRFASLSATLVITIAVGATAAWGALSLDSDTPDRPVGPRPEPRIVRLLTEPRGFLEIEAHAGQACYRFEMRGATSAHIHEQSSNSVVIELASNIAGNYGFLGCAEGLDPPRLRAIAERPSDHLVEFHAATGGSETATLTPDVGEPECLPTELTSPEYRLHFAKTEGQPGERITVWGPTLRSEDGTFTPSGGFELWWNAEVPDERRPKKEGEAIRLTSVPTNDRCYFLTSFRVPDVPGGQYDITGFIWDEPPSESYGVFPGTTFTVRSPEDRSGDL